MDDMYLDHLLEPLSTGMHPLRPWHSATIFLDGTRFDITIGQQKFLGTIRKNTYSPHGRNKVSDCKL